MIYFKKTLIYALIFVFGSLSTGVLIASENFSSRLAGRILLQVEEKGEAWYVDPETLTRYYLGRPQDAFNLMRKKGIGISNKDIATIPVSVDSLEVLHSNGVSLNLINNLSMDNISGQLDAPVTLFVFTDLQCPFCARHYPTLIKLLKEYDGKVRVVWKHLPLTFHEYAYNAALALECAADQGRFEGYLDLVFEDNQYLPVNVLKQHALTLDLDQKDFNSCLDTFRNEARIVRDLQEADSLNISGTPTTFVIKGNLSNATYVEKIAGVTDYDVFKTTVEKFLGMN